MTNEQKLLPCPFCGGTNVRVFGPIGWHRQYGISHSCSVFFGGSGDFTVSGGSAEQATAAWNTRAALAATEPAPDCHQHDLVTAGQHNPNERKEVMSSDTGNGFNPCATSPGVTAGADRRAALRAIGGDA